jgi:hypothetical protein
VTVPLLKKVAWTGLILLLARASALAQSWGAGVTIGAVNDIEHRFHWEEFKSKDVNGYLEVEIQDKVIVRATLGEMKVKGENAGKTFTLSDSSTIKLPDLINDIRYATVGVSYEFWEGSFTSGLFAGIGGYKIEPRDVPAAIANYRDQRETSFGWHGGVEGGFQLVKHLSLMGRLTFHGILSSSERSLLTANAGLAYRF